MEQPISTIQVTMSIPPQKYMAAAEWMAKQGVSYQATISADKTIPVLPMKDVSDMGLDYGDKVRIIILPEEG